MKEGRREICLGQEDDQGVGNGMKEGNMVGGEEGGQGVGNRMKEGVVEWWSGSG